MARKSLFISIKPRFAELIFSGNKTVELRRKEPKVSPGDTMIVYVSSPVKEVIGSCTVIEIETDAPSKLWSRIRAKAGISKAEFDEYFEGATTAVAIHLEDPRFFQNPVGLDNLRSDYSIDPPQSFCYVDRLAFGRKNDISVLASV